jgi:hypothetical protein
MAGQLTGKWTNGKAANRWESQLLTQDVGGGGVQDSPPNKVAGMAANGQISKARDCRCSSVLRIRIRMDPHHFGKLDPDPHQSERQDPGSA